MELLLRVLRPTHAAVDVRVDIDPDQPTARLATALAELVGGAPTGAPPSLLLARTGALLDLDAPVRRSGVLSGDELVLDPGPLPPPPLPLPIQAVSVDVLAGPDSGHSAVLDRGTYLLGRDGSCDIVVSDSTVSRRHLRIGWRRTGR